MGVTDREGMVSLAHVSGSDAEQVVHRTIGDVLCDAAQRWPSRAALVDGASEVENGRRWTFAGMLLVSDNVARSLLTRFAPGDHVAVWAANGPEWVFMEFGAALAGMTLVTINPAYLADELAFVLRQSQSSGIVVQDRYRGRNLLPIVGGIRAGLPGLKEVIPLSSWRSFLSEASSAGLPSIKPGGTSRPGG